MSTNLVGQTLLNQFRVDAFIAAGGMGTVYKAWDSKRTVTLAMKVLHADLAEDPSIFKRFEREARALEKLTHPNIVPFYGLYHTLDIAFLLERFIDGCTLKSILRERRNAPLPLRDVLVYLQGVTSALGYAHAHGVVHCDVKPGNVMVDQGGAVYLTDFGVARHAESTTTTIGFAGTAAYMAPEQCRDEPVTPATDVYAMGIMLFEMLTGRRPFRGDENGTEKTQTAAERVRHAHLHLAPPDPREFNPNLSEKLSKLILKALAKKPEHRYARVRDLFEQLCQALDRDPDSIPDRIGQKEKPISVPLSLGGDTERRADITPKRSPAQRWLIAGIAAVVLVVGGIAFLSGGEDSRSSGYPQGNNPSRTRQADISQVTEQSLKSLASGSDSGESKEKPRTLASPTYTPRPEPTFTRSVTGTIWRPIEGCPRSRLRIGDWTRVTLLPPLPNRLRAQPDLDTGEILTKVQPGGVLKVRDGPVCNDGMLWWEMMVQESGTIGWMAEGDGSDFWLDPGSDVSP